MADIKVKWANLHKTLKGSSYSCHNIRVLNDWLNCFFFLHLKISVATAAQMHLLCNNPKTTRDEIRQVGIPINPRNPAPFPGGL
jgi:hypothetical protein